ncbi:histidine kinase N-terminal 7TM domain-containing protein [Haloarcula sp. Atlit-7R]|uniref:sensor histidine kinase n=1 Tax=Haloarcula sp. Atlit-7R TaxID=2282125 RepID=UPI000EF153D0|nr:histidine kinase N-terminal 7TM domain-containing protein [Haloarcula sp. Atlit-7R]RLM89084.1 histidine kinase [Haloarcula sp. Atlit-7R]
MITNDVSPVFIIYVFAYGLATLGCVIALKRAIHITDADTRRGLVGLLVGSGSWAALQLAFLIAPTPAIGYGAYTLSLIIGLTTVGAWLYFASAYTGRSFHRDRMYRRLALAIYIAIIAVKVTNPLHGWYFQTRFVTVPFPHLTIMHGTFHWVVTGLSYALVAVGFFMLYELFLEADYDTRPLAILVGITGLPVVFDIIGFASDFLIEINYEPLGVAVFAIGVLYVFEEEFLAVQLTDNVNAPVIYLNRNDRINHHNRRAKQLFPDLIGATGEPLDVVIPSASAKLGDQNWILDWTSDNETKHYLVSDTPFSLGRTDIGRMVLFTDVTQTERQRRELERQNEQLEGFAAAIRHELLNTLQIVSARIDIAGDAVEDGEVDLARDSLQTASDASQRMADIVDDLANLARYGQSVEASQTETVDIESIAKTAWATADIDDGTLLIEENAELTADPERLEEIFFNAFIFGTHNGATKTIVAVTDNGFTITDDGMPTGDTDPSSYFEYGSAIPDAEAGLTLPNLRVLAETHDWEVTLDTSYQGGIRIVVSGVNTLSQ